MSKWSNSSMRRWNLSRQPAARDAHRERHRVALSPDLARPNCPADRQIPLCQPVPKACATTTVTADQQVQRSEQACIQIVPAPATPPDKPRAGVEPTPVTPAIPPARQPDATRQPRDKPSDGQTPRPRPPADGRLVLTLSDLGDPVRVGEKARYYVTIRNARRSTDRAVVLTVVLPERNSGFTATPPPAIRYDTSLDRRMVTFSPIAEMRSEETVEFVIEVTLNEPGPAVLRAQVTSQNSPQPVTAEEDTTFAVGESGT